MRSGVERDAELVFDRSDDLAQAPQLAPAGAGDGDDVAAPVLRVALPDDQSSRLERVEHRDQAARVEAERVPDRRLRLTGALGEDGEEAAVDAAPSPRPRPPSIALALKPVAEARQQEAGAGEQLLGDPVVGRYSISETLS